MGVGGAGPDHVRIAKNEEERMVSIDTAEATGVPFDPFELKDTVSGHIRDPFPMLRELRRECPVHSGRSTSGRVLMTP